MRTLPAAVALLLLLAPGHDAVAQTCPTNFFAIGSALFYFEDTSTLPSRDWVFGTSYNLVVGTVGSSTAGSGETGSFSELYVQDLYTIVGPASATPIEFVARVRFTGNAEAGAVNLPGGGGPICAGSSARLRFDSGGGLADEKQPGAIPLPECASRAFEEILNLPLAKLPGEQFPLGIRVSLNAGYSIGILAAGQLEFVGLPPGYTVQSCQGYALLPVAAKTTTWGRLKRIYR